MINVLIFSDQNKYSSGLMNFLNEKNCNVEILSGVNTNIVIDLTSKYDAILIDLEYKRTNGYAILSKIREYDKVIPLMVLSSNKYISEKIFAYKLGADDYILKSNPIEEILFRMQILIKKIDLNKFGINNEIVIGDLRINVKTLNVHRDNIEIKLTKKEFLLLKTLANSHGQILNKSELMNKIWQGNEKTRDNVVEVCINSLRKKIDKNFKSKLIHTKVGLGYYLA